MGGLNFTYNRFVNFMSEHIIINSKHICYLMLLSYTCWDKLNLRNNSQQNENFTRQKLLHGLGTGTV